MNTKLWGGIVVTILVIGGIIWAHNQAPVDMNVPQEVKNDVVFYDQATGEAVPASFGASSVTFTEESLGTMTLPQAMSASGARYANADESIVFWNKGDSVFITQNGTIIFNGSTSTPAVSTDTPKGKLPAGSKAPGDPKALIGTWVWDRTVMRDGSVLIPNKSGVVFTLTLTTDGKVSGKTDCNGFGGEYKIGSDGFISFGPFVSTQMYCEGSQESIYTNALLKATRYAFDARLNLVINIEGGTSTMIFTKK